MSTLHMDTVLRRLDRLEHVVIVVIALVVAACTATGYSVTTPVTAPRTVRPPTDVHPELAPYLPRFVQSLEKFGFPVGPPDDSRALQLHLDFDPSVNGIPTVLVVSATVGGQGTRPGRPAPPPPCVQRG